MSRAYRIRVKESLARDVRAEDCIETQLEILEVLPPEDMGELLAAELEQRGFERQEDGTLVRREPGGESITVEPCSGKVTVTAEATGRVDIEGSREGYGYDDVGPKRRAIEEKLSKELKADLEKKAEQQAAKTQSAATDKLEKKLREIQPELSEVVNKVTGEALKQKAAQMGEIKEVSGDAQSGTLTIKVEV
jgi:FtsH ternary system domain X5